MSRGIYEVCTCGHRYPEHSLFGTCYGCVECLDVEERPEHDEDLADHTYRRCDCARFASVDGDAEPTDELEDADSV